MASRPFSFIGTIIFALITLSFQNCGLIEQPRLENRSTLASTFGHTGITTSCSTCHGTGQMADPYKKNQSLAVHRPTGGLDCSSCHKFGSTMSDWKTFARYPHNPTPATCTQCHEPQRPAPVAGVPHGNNGECAVCHTSSTSWKTGVAFNHQPTPTQCTSCHGPGAANDPYVKNPNLPPHRPKGSEECIACHTPTDWRSASYKHTPVPTSCNSCHNFQRPATTVYPGSATTQNSHYNAKDCYSCHQPLATFSFGHSNAINQNINFCLPCHQAQGARKHSNHPEYFVGDGTCYSCHNVKRRSWDQ